MSVKWVTIGSCGSVSETFAKMAEGGAWGGVDAEAFVREQRGDEPHRLVYDLCAEVDRLNARLDAIVERLRTDIAGCETAAQHGVTFGGDTMEKVLRSILFVADGKGTP